MLWMLRYRSRRKISARCLLFASKPCGTGVEKDFQKVRNRMSFFCPPCCCKGMERSSKHRLPLPANKSLQIFSRSFENKCRFGGSKVAVGWWEEILREIGSVLAPDARRRLELAPFWRQKAKAKAGFSRVASILMPPSKGKSGCGIKIDATEKFFLRKA